MIELAREDGNSSTARLGTQPIALAAITLLVLLAAVAGMALWRAYTGMPPELDRAMAVRQWQLRAAQTSEQLMEQTRGLGVTQQESIDQLQIVQDQLQQVRKLLAAQQTDIRHLSDQVSALTEAVDGLRQSFANAQNSEPSGPPPTRHRALRARAHAARFAHGKPDRG